MHLDSKKYRLEIDNLINYTQNRGVYNIWHLCRIRLKTDFLNELQTLLRAQKHHLKKKWTFDTANTPTNVNKGPQKSAKTKPFI